jgi:hypothetical protein
VHEHGTVQVASTAITREGGISQFGHVIGIAFRMIEDGGGKSPFRVVPETCVDKGVTISLAILANDVPLPPPATPMAPQGAHRLGGSLPSRMALVVLDVLRYRREPSCTSPCREGARSFQGRGSATACSGIVQVSFGSRAKRERPRVSRRASFRDRDGQRRRASAPATSLPHASRSRRSKRTT